MEFRDFENDIWDEYRWDRYFADEEGAFKDGNFVDPDFDEDVEDDIDDESSFPGGIRQFLTKPERSPVSDPVYRKAITITMVAYRKVSRTSELPVYFDSFLFNLEDCRAFIIAGCSAMDEKKTLGMAISHFKRAVRLISKSCLILHRSKREKKLEPSLREPVFHMLITLNRELEKRIKELRLEWKKHYG
ncbi:MAG: hypothetical protein ACLFQK_08260 [Fibrobacterota bacterium]